MHHWLWGLSDGIRHPVMCTERLCPQLLEWCHYSAKWWRSEICTAKTCAATHHLPHTISHLPSSSQVIDLPVSNLFVSHIIRRREAFGKERTRTVEGRVESSLPFSFLISHYGNATDLVKLKEWKKKNE